MQSAICKAASVAFFFVDLSWLFSVFLEQGVPEKKVLPVTVPKSPVFALKSRTRMTSRDEEKVTVDVLL